MNTPSAGSSSPAATLEGLGAGRLLQDGPGLFRAVRAFGRSVGTDETAVAASLLCQAWAVSVTRAAIAGLVGARRVPDMASSNTVLLFDGSGRPVGSTTVTPRFAAVAGDDDAAADPRAEIVERAQERRLDEELFGGHLGVLVEALHDLAPVGRRLLWGNVAAATAGGFAALSALDRHPFDPDHVLPEAARLLDHPGSLTDGLAEMYPVTNNGITRLFVRRQTCCLRYRLPDAPPTCLSCRLLPEPERRRRIALRLDLGAR